MPDERAMQGILNAWLGRECVHMFLSDLKEAGVGILPISALEAALAERDEAKRLCELALKANAEMRDAVIEEAAKFVEWDASLAAAIRKLKASP